MGIRKAFLLFLFILLFVNALVIRNYLTRASIGSSHQYEQIIQSVSSEQLKPNEISLKLNILDIYRLDISCDYITRDLSQPLSTEYKNSKKCSFSSLKRNVDEMVKKSLNHTKIEKYSPVYDSSDFEPFDTKPNQLPQFQNLKQGGLFTPRLTSSNPCETNDLDFVVFLVPYSNSRLDNLKLFLINLHKYLQSLNKGFIYQILVVEQINENSLFNKGRLINRGVKYISESYENVDCIVIHDVDLIPSEDGEGLGERGDYRCRQMPWHMSNEVYLMSSRQSRVYNQFLTGGILALRPKHFRGANGFSNEYFGWGAEDDDWTLRMFSSRLCIMRPKGQLSRQQAAPFVMLNHAPSKANSKRFQQLSTAVLNKYIDGFSNVENLTDLVKVEQFATFTYLAVDVLKN